MSAYIVLWSAMLGFAYLAGAAVYFELVLAKRLSAPAASSGFGRHGWPRQTRIGH